MLVSSINKQQERWFNSISKKVLYIESWKRKELKQGGPGYWKKESFVHRKLEKERIKTRRTWLLEKAKVDIFLFSLSES